MLIGFDIGGTKIEGAVLSAGGETLARERVATPRGDYEAGLAVIAGLVAGFENRFGRADGLGFGVPGSLSPATGLIRNANSTWLNGRPFGADLEHALGRPVRVENDANCLAVSEAVDGAGAGAKIVFAVIVGTGCGAGVAIEGRALSGRQGVAGEFGHNPLPRPTGPAEHPGPQCWCGRRGCLETFLSGPGFSARHEEATGRRAEAAVLFADARIGDDEARRSVEIYLDRLARALASVVNLIDPDVIVLGGGMSKEPELHRTMTDRIRPHVFSDVFETPVLPAAHGDSSGVRGAAWLWR